MKKVLAAAALCAVASALTPPYMAQAATPSRYAAALQLEPGISITTPLSMVQQPLPLFRLTRTAPPVSVVQGAVAKTGAMAMERSRMVARDKNDVMHAYADAQTGEAQIFPDLAAGSGPAVALAAIQNQAGAVFARADMVPKDATQTVIGDATPVLSAQAARSASGQTTPMGAPNVLFTYVQAKRTAAGLPVVGNGSQLTVGIGNDGSIHALVRRWQAAYASGTVTPTTTPEQLAKAIDQQLHPLANSETTITVDSVTPAYYDGDGHFLQPVYMFFATLHNLSNRTADDHIRGYVPVGKTVEEIPVIGQNRGPGPTEPTPAKLNAGPNISQITLGEYANRDGAMLDMANAYNNGFNAYPSGWFGRPPTNRVQWYWAYPYQVQSNIVNYYLNSVNIAYTQPHGDWWFNTTKGNNADAWAINNIGVGGNIGYGAATGGQLATWIIDSCEVVPSFYDLQYTTGNGYTAFNYWWPVFQGLHRVLGFRTEMLLGEDAMNWSIGRDMEEGVAADSAFWNEVAAVSFPTYTNTHLNLTVHFDRVSIMRDTRNYNETIYSVQGQSASGQLNNVWMGN